MGSISVQGGKLKNIIKLQINDVWINLHTVIIWDSVQQNHPSG